VDRIGNCNIKQSDPSGMSGPGITAYVRGMRADRYTGYLANTLFIRLQSIQLKFQKILHFITPRTSVFVHQNHRSYKQNYRRSRIHWIHI